LGRKRDTLKCVLPGILGLYLLCLLIDLLLPEKELMIYVLGLPYLASLFSFRTGLDELLLFYATALGQVVCLGLAVHLNNRWSLLIVGVVVATNLLGGRLVMEFIEALATGLTHGLHSPAWR